MASPKKASVEKVKARFSRNSQDRTDFLLDVASKFFLEKGYEAASVNEMARYAHASKETFYSRYPTKQDLFRAVMMRRTQTAGAPLTAILNDYPMEEALTRFGDFLLHRILTDETIATQRTLAMDTRRFPEIAQIFYEHGPLWLINSLATFLKKRVASGELRTMDCALVARQLMGLFIAELQTRAALGIEPKPGELERKQRVKSAVDFFLRAYKA